MTHQSKWMNVLFKSASLIFNVWFYFSEVSTDLYKHVLSNLIQSDLSQFALLTLSEVGPH